MSIYLITETNGSDSLKECSQAIVMAEGTFNASKADQLLKELKSIKQAAAEKDECLDADDVIQAACNTVFGVGRWIAPSYRDIQF